MNKLIKILVIIFLLVLIGVGIKYLATEEEKGFLEKTGEKIDRQINKLEREIDPEGPMEKAGKKIDETFENIGDKIEELKK